MRKNKGFTLIELLVVVAIIGILVAVVLVSLGAARDKGADSAIKSNLDTIKTQAEIFYNDNGNSYLPSNAPSAIDSNECSSLDPNSETSMFSKDQTIYNALNEAKKRGNGCQFTNYSDAWAVAVGLKSDSNTSWCVDNLGTSKKIDNTYDEAINDGTYACN